MKEEAALESSKSRKRIFLGVRQDDKYVFEEYS